MGKLYFSFIVKKKMSFRYQLLTFLIIFVLVSLFVAISISQEKLSAEDYFHIAEEKYTEGQVEEAIVLVKKCLQINPHYEIAKVLLDLALDELSFKYYTQQNYDKALLYLEELYKLHPDNEEIKEMYEYAKRQVSRTKLESLPGVAPGKEIKKVEKMFSDLEARYRKLSKLFDEYKHEQKLSTKGIPDITRTLSNRLEEMENKMKNYNKQMLIDMEIERMKLKKTYTYGLIIGLFCFFLLIGYIMIRRKSESKYQARLLRQYEQKIITKILPKAIRQEADIIPGTLPRKIIKTPLKQLTTEKKIEMIKAIKNELPDTKNTKLGINLLKPFLDDKNISVRLEALRVLYNFDKDRSLRVLELLAKDKEPAVRLETVRILGEIMTVESVSILLSGVYDNDINVRKVIIKNLNEIEKKGTISSKYFNEKLKYLLDELRRKERWIIG